MGNIALIHAVRGLSLPEHIVRAVVADYMDFLQQRQSAKRQALDERLLADEELSDRMFFEAQGSMLASTLILTLDESVDVPELLREAYGAQTDPDLLAMRKELVSRALRQAKDAAALASVSTGVVKERKALFCQED
jgi:hypothetical protein